jgi:hypothetical protein
MGMVDGQNEAGISPALWDISVVLRSLKDPPLLQMIGDFGVDCLRFGKLGVRSMEEVDFLMTLFENLFQVNWRKWFLNKSN